MNFHEMAVEIRRLSDNLNDALDKLRESTANHATADVAFRRAKAVAYLQASGTVAEREAHAILESIAEYEAMTLADALRVSMMEVVRSRRQQISALQTLANGLRAEAEFVRTGPDR